MREDNKLKVIDLLNPIQALSVLLHSLHTIFTNCLSLLSQISKISLPQGHFIIPVTSNSLLLLPTGIIISCKCIGIGNIVVTCFFFPNNHIISISYLFVKCKFAFCHVFSSSNFRFIELSIPYFSMKEYSYMKNVVVLLYNYFARISRNLSLLHTGVVSLKRGNSFLVQKKHSDYENPNACGRM